MSLDADHLREHLPSYLSAEDQKRLVAALQAISGGGRQEYLLGSYENDFKELMLQGDGWRGFRAYDYEREIVVATRGLVLSNSCDLAPDNPRATPSRVTFAPLVKLAAYEELLQQSGIKPESIEDKISSIKAQKITNIFFLPAGGDLAEDYIVRLDEAQSMPIAVQEKSAEREKLFTLSMVGFYMLVFKISVHFCRLQEGVPRLNATAAAA